jgi:hypothetical protein
MPTTTVGGVSLSGDGESLIRTTLAARVMRSLEASAARRGDRGGLRPSGQGRRRGRDDRHRRRGSVDWGHNSAQFAVAHASAGQPRPRLRQSGEDAQEDLMTLSNRRRPLDHHRRP